MPYFRQERVIRASRKALFDMVADIAAYPQFVPNCAQAAVREVAPNHLTARLVAEWGPFSEAYTSDVILTPFDKIVARSNDGPFKDLKNIWTFADAERNGQIAVRVSCEIDCTFKSFLLSKAATPFFKEGSAQMMDAFLKRVSAPQAGRLRTRKG